jgi:hypothetical protein
MSAQTTTPPAAQRTSDDMEDSDRKRMNCSPEDAQQLQQLRTQLQNNIQQSRAAHHNFEPVSLPGSQPVSRVSIKSEMISQQLKQVNANEIFRSLRDQNDIYLPVRAMSLHSHHRRRRLCIRRL